MFFALLIAFCSISLQTLQFHTPPHGGAGSTPTSISGRLQGRSGAAAVSRAKDLALMMLRSAAYGAAVTELALRLLPDSRARRATAAAGLAMAAAWLGLAVKITGPVFVAAAAGGAGTRSTGAAYYCFYYVGLVAVRAVACAGLVHALLGVVWGADHQQVTNN